MPCSAPNRASRASRSTSVARFVAVVGTQAARSDTRRPSVRLGVALAVVGVAVGIAAIVTLQTMRADVKETNEVNEYRCALSGQCEEATVDYVWPIVLGVLAAVLLIAGLTQLGNGRAVIVQAAAAPAKPTPSTRPPPGFYRDPKNSNERRWWDGEGWTDHRPDDREGTG